MQKTEYIHYRCSEELIKELEKDDHLIRSYIVSSDGKLKYEKQIGNDGKVYIAELKMGSFERLGHRMGLGYESHKTVQPENTGVCFEIFSPRKPPPLRKLAYWELMENAFRKYNGPKSSELPQGVGRTAAGETAYFITGDSRIYKSVITPAPPLTALQKHEQEKLFEMDLKKDYESMLRKMKNPSPENLPKDHRTGPQI